MNAAKGGFCSRAIPLLESAESQRHRPSSALVLADCYVKGRELVKASRLYHLIAAEQSQQPGYTVRDEASIPAAKRKAAQVDARIPTLVVSPPEAYDDLEIEINGERVSDPTTPQQVDPRVLVTVVVRAEGHRTYTEKVKLKEKERRVLKPRLKPKPGAKKPPPEEPRPRPTPKVEPKNEPEKVPAKAPEKEPAKTSEKAPPKAPSKKKPGKKPAKAPEPKPEKEPEPEPEKELAKAPKEPHPPRAKRGAPKSWIGVGYQGFVIPKFLMNIFGDGGNSFLAPGGEVSYTTKKGRFDLVFALAYASFTLGDTPFKPNGHPDTDYEIIASDLQALQASARVVLDYPLDAQGEFSFRLGAGLGVGWTFLGDFYRTQAYPRDLVPGDPYAYLKCRGPNNPAGSFRYCNQLDYDANHYNGYVEPSWFTRPKGRPAGLRPTLYPWLVLPELGISYHPSEKVAVDLKVGASVTGFLTGLGVRFAL